MVSRLLRHTVLFLISYHCPTGKALHDEESKVPAVNSVENDEGNHDLRQKIYSWRKRREELEVHNFSDLKSRVLILGPSGRS